MLFLKLEASKSIVLTYQLEKTKIDVLTSILQTLNFCGHIAAVKDLKSIFAAPHFIAFLNFASIDEMQEQGFFTKIQQQGMNTSPKRSCNGGIPLTYIENCKTSSHKQPYVFVNRDVFGDRDRLRLILLQKLKDMEGRKPSEPVSKRFERVLTMYHNLMYYGCLMLNSDVSLRRFYQDMAIIKILVPDVFYDKKQGKYTAKYLPDKETTRQAMLAVKVPTRLRRLLLIYQELLYEGWITKSVADKICEPVSLRMFQRDLAVIDTIEPIYFDMDQKKYVLAARCSQESISAGIRCRNEYRRA